MRKDKNYKVHGECTSRVSYTGLFSKIKNVQNYWYYIEKKVKYTHFKKNIFQRVWKQTCNLFFDFPRDDVSDISYTEFITDEEKRYAISLINQYKLYFLINNSFNFVSKLVSHHRCCLKFRKILFISYNFFFKD